MKNENPLSFRKYFVIHLKTWCTWRFPVLPFLLKRSGINKMDLFLTLHLQSKSENVIIVIQVRLNHRIKRFGTQRSN